MNQSLDLLIKGRSRGRGLRLQSEKTISKILNLNQKALDLNNNIVNNVQPKENLRFENIEESDDDMCRICERPTGNLICKTCGHIWKGRQRVQCPTHKNTLFLMDFTLCASCRSEDIKELN